MREIKKNNGFWELYEDGVFKGRSPVFKIDKPPRSKKKLECFKGIFKLEFI